MIFLELSRAGIRTFVHIYPWILSQRAISSQLSRMQHIATHMCYAIIVLVVLVR